MPNFFVQLFDEAYIYPPSCHTAHPLLSPGKASDELLRTLPHDIVIYTCEWDMLRAEADAFAYRLRQGIGKNATHTIIPQVAHAWDKAPNPFHVAKGASRFYKEAAMKLERLFKISPGRCIVRLMPKPRGHLVPIRNQVEMAVPTIPSRLPQQAY